MIYFNRIALGFFVLLTLSFSSEKVKVSEITVNELKQHVRYLASDQLKGRLTGSEGDSLAAEYIRGDLKKSGLKPLYDNGFQHFRIIDKVVAGQGNKLKIDNINLIINTDYAPLSFSQNGNFCEKAIFAGYGFEINEDSLKWNDYQDIAVKGKIVVILRGDPEIEKPASPFIRYSRDRDKALLAKDHGAICVLFVSGKSFDAEDKFEPLVKGEMSVGIPVFHISRKSANLIFESNKITAEDLEKKLNETRKPAGFETTVTVSGKADVVQTTLPTRNVIMEIPGSDKILKNEFVVIGAHFDHLGMGGPGSGSRVPDTLGIHYGADDNASGVALTMALAKKLAADGKNLKRSIIVATFSGEEEGLLGSKRFLDSAKIDLSKVNAMVNLDMTGRLTDNSRLQISGVGTSDVFKQLIYASCDTNKLKVSLSEEGYGPSDHASFYGKNIPVLFATTGAHLDYHTPADTWDKINYSGMVEISDLAYKVILELANGSRLTFKEAGPKTGTSRGTRRKGITLGIMPDFAGNVKNGLRADFVTPNKPAALGGMQKGDIITFINGKPVNNIQDYMFRLNQLKRGETISVEVLRGNEKVVLVIQL